MRTTTPAEIHETIAAALLDRASRYRTMAASHKWCGPAKADSRALMREEAKLCEDLHRIMGHVNPEALAALLAAKAA